MALTVLLEARPMRAADAVPVVVRLAGLGSRAYTHAGVNDWLAGITDAPRFSSALAFGQSGWTGGAVPTTGAIGFAPSDRARIDALAALVWDDAAVTIWTGDDAGADPVWTVALDGVVAGIATRDGVLTITVADLSKKLARPIAADRFTGKGGIEGGSDAAERLKRRSFGRCWGVEARLLDKAANVYEVGDPARPLSSIDMVKDRGRAASAVSIVAWAGSIAATLDALKAAAVPQGGAAVAPSIACVKWWTQPSGPLTVDLRGEIGAGYVETVAEIAARIADAAGLPTLNVAAAAESRAGAAGLHVDSDGETAAQALDRLLLRASLLWLLEPAGAVRLLPIGFDAAAPVVDAIDASREASYKPVTRVVLGYQRNHRPHNAGEISAVFQASDGNYADGTPIEELKPAVRSADITSANTAAGIFGQGAFATQSRLDLDNGSFFTLPGRFQSYPGNANFFGAWKIAFGDGAGLDALQPGERGANVTEWRTASAILGQSPFATLAAGTSLDNSIFGLPERLLASAFGPAFLRANNVAFAAGNTIEGLRPGEAGANVTEWRTASAILGQSPFATLAAGTSLDNSIFGLPERLLASSFGPAFLRANNVAFAAGNTIEGLRPGEAGANITEGRTAAAFLGQGALATLNYLGADRVGFKAGGGNFVRNSGLDGPTHNIGTDLGTQTLPAGYGPYNNAGADDPTQWRVVGGYGRNGGPCVAMSWTRNTSTKGVYLSGIGGIDNRDIMKAGRIYCVSLYARGTGAAIGRTMFVTFNYHPIENVTIENPPMTDQYQRYVFRLRWGATVDRELYWSISGADGVATMDLDDFQIEEGDTPTAYAPGLLPGELRAPLLAWDAVRLGQNVTRADGTTVATDNMLVTTLGTAAAIAGQGVLATLSSLSRTGGLLTGFGGLSGFDHVKLGTSDSRGFGLVTQNGFGTSDVQLITDQGVAAAIAGQGALATQSGVAYGSQISGLPAAIGPSAFFDSGRLLYASRVVYDDAGVVSAYRPEEAGSNRTESRSAAAVIGQGPFATASGGQSLDNSGLFSVPTRLRQHPLNSDFLTAQSMAYASGAQLQDLQPQEGGSNRTETRTASAIAGQGALATEDRIQGDSQLGGVIAQRLTPYPGDHNFLGAGRVAWDEGNSVQALKPGERGANVTEARSAAAITGQGPFATASGGQSLDNSGLFSVPTRLRQHPLNSDFLTAQSMAYASGAQLQDLQPQEGGSNRTETRTASAIVGQGAFATAPQIGSWNVASYYNFSAFKLDYSITRSDGVSIVTEAISITQYGIAAAFAGQGALATRNTVTGDEVVNGKLKNTSGSVLWDLAAADGRRQIENAGYRYVDGAAIGASGDLITWYGPTSVAAGTETKTNGRWAMATDGKIYYGTAELGTGGAAGSKKKQSDFGISLSAGVTRMTIVGGVQLAGVPAAPFIDLTVNVQAQSSNAQLSWVGAIDVVAVDANGSETLIAETPASYTASSESWLPEEIAVSRVSSRAGTVEYQVRMRRTGGSSVGLAGQGRIVVMATPQG